MGGFWGTSILWRSCGPVDEAHRDGTTLTKPRQPARAGARAMAPTTRPCGALWHARRQAPPALSTDRPPTRPGPRNPTVGDGSLAAPEGGPPTRRISDVYSCLVFCVCCFAECGCGVPGAPPPSLPLVCGPRVRPSAAHPQRSGFKKTNSRVLARTHCARLLIALVSTPTYKPT